MDLLQRGHDQKLQAEPGEQAEREPGGLIGAAAARSIARGAVMTVQTTTGRGDRWGRCRAGARLAQSAAKPQQSVPPTGAARNSSPRPSGGGVE